MSLHQSAVLFTNNKSYKTIKISGSNKMEFNSGIHLFPAQEINDYIILITKYIQTYLIIESIRA